MPDESRKKERRRKQQNEAQKRYREKYPGRHREAARLSKARRSPEKRADSIEQNRQYRIRAKSSWEGHAKWLVETAKKRSLRKGTESDFQVTPTWVLRRLKEQEYKCLVSGKPLELQPERSFYPWQPSLDRIDNSRGYTRKNTRVVCLMFNLCRNNSSDDEIVVFARHLVAQTDENS